MSNSSNNNEMILVTLCLSSFVCLSLLPNKLINYFKMSANKEMRNKNTKKRITINQTNIIHDELTQTNDEIIQKQIMQKYIKEAIAPFRNKLLCLKKEMQTLQTTFNNEQKKKKLVLFGYEFSSNIYELVISFTYLFRELLYGILATYIIMSLIDIQRNKQ